MRLVAAAFLAAAVATTGLAAPPQLGRWNPAAPENKQLLPAFSLTTISPVLNAIGARHQRVGSDAARPALLATFGNGRKALLSLSSCDRTGLCKALSIQSFWTKSAKAPAERTADAIQRFNQRYAFAKAFVTPDGRPSLQRYLTADYGFLRGDLAVNLLVFADQAELLSAQFLEPLERAGR